MGAEATLQDVAAPGARSRARSWLRRRRPRRPRDATRSFALTFLMVAILAAFLSPILRAVMVSLKTPDQLSETNAPFLPSLPQTFDVRRARPTTSTSCRSTAGAARWPWSSPAGRRASSSTPRTRRPPPIVWDGAWRTLERSWTLAPAWQNFADVWAIIDFPRLLFNTIAIALIGMIGTDRLVHARRVRVRPVPVPGPDAPVHAPDRDDLPAGGRDARPDVHDLREDRLGGDMAAAARPDVLRQRVRRVPAPPVHADDPARDGRGRLDRRRRAVPDADLGDPAAGVARDRRGGDLPPRLLVERLLRPADLPVDEARAPDRSPSGSSSSTASTTATRPTSRRGP